MSLYTFSPIKSQEELLEAIQFIHVECHKLCKNSFGQYLPNSGNVGVFCQYDDEFEFLKGVRVQLCESSSDPNTKYFKLHAPIVIAAEGDVPETVYEFLYIRRPDPYQHQVGELDFVLEQAEYDTLKAAMLAGKKVPGARVFERPDLDMIELYNPDVDALAYVSPHAMTQKVRTAQSAITKL